MLSNVSVCKTPLSLCVHRVGNRNKLIDTVRRWLLTCTSLLRCRMASSFSLISSSTVIFSLGVQHNRQEYLATKDRVGRPIPPSPIQLSAEPPSPCPCPWTAITSSPWTTMMSWTPDSTVHSHSRCVCVCVCVCVWERRNVKRACVLRLGCCTALWAREGWVLEYLPAQSNVWEMKS